MNHGKRIGWGISYRIRVDSNSKWCRWVGPVGVYGVAHVPQRIREELSNRPYFFRTRVQARKIAQARTIESNKTWTWCQYAVKKYKLSWMEQK